ncbi:MAG: DNA helicase [Acidimicrobiales bacterium]|nr:MAG: DNA helicase [Acidimicrobiales bacterium]
MTQVHPELEAEQRYIDHAYECLEATRRAASRLGEAVDVTTGGTNQARFERDVLWDTMIQRLTQLDLGERALCFGRIDRETDDGGTETFYIGRVAVADENQEPVIVDWRAPVAEPFYRATGRNPMGLRRRRHFATRGRRLLGIEDELFGSALEEMDEAPDRIRGRSTLLAALESNRTGRLADIVATIQAEQDEIIRDELPGVLVVQGGPGTGKTVVALHRAAYLLYTHRFPLEGQGVLVVGPNKLFLGYISQVLPSLGEAGVELAVLADFVDDVRVLGSDQEHVARIKGDLRMVDVIRRAVRDRERPLREDLVVGYGIRKLRFTVDQSRRLVRAARRRFKTHNAARQFVERGLFAALADSTSQPLDPREVRERLRTSLQVRRALEWMWPLLTPAELLNDLFGSAALLRSAAAGLLSEEEWRALARPRAERSEEVVWRVDDVPLLDEARALLGPRRPGPETEIRTYGHIVVDEAQDLSPMQLRMLARRSLNGSMTVVGDIAQSTGAWAHSSWDEVLEHLPNKRPARVRELTIGYRIPASILAPAAAVLAHAAPGLKPPSSVREGEEHPVWQRVSGGRDAMAEAVVEIVRHELSQVGAGNVGVICPSSLHDAASEALQRAGIPHGRALKDGLDNQVTVVPVAWVKGLELDSVVVVEPGSIVREEPQGMRSLYVALTRATKRLTIVYENDLPEPLRPLAVQE